MILELAGEAIEGGAGRRLVCARLGVSPRTLERWRMHPSEGDQRRGPLHAPKNQLSEDERRRVLSIANSQQYRDISPKQIVPQLADQGVYVASESTFYRLLRGVGQMAHRGRAKAPTPRPVPQLLAQRPNQVWTWDITYLRGPIRGEFYYLYLMTDLYSRRVVGWHVAEEESKEHAARLFERAWRHAGRPAGLTLHSDNGGPMKGSTMLATLQRLGVVPSFSRPRVSDDNPFSEALFRTAKYHPSYPRHPFQSLDKARAWAEWFIAWYNGEHRHSAIRFVTPNQRYYGKEKAVLDARNRLYRRSRSRHPERWSQATRNWEPVGQVRLGPDPYDLPCPAEQAA